MQVTSKPGYSWRVGVFPPAKAAHEMSALELLVQERSTRPALMVLELQEVDEEDTIPEIRLHLFRADMVGVQRHEVEAWPNKDRGKGNWSLHLFRADVVCVSFIVSFIVSMSGRVKSSKDCKRVLDGAHSGRTLWILST